MKSNEPRILSQFSTLFLRNIELFLNDKKKVLSTMAFPLLIGLVIVFVAKDSFFQDYESTKSALLTVVSAGIYVGMFNSLTSVCKERKIIKREYMTNMKLISYVFALATFQGLICITQSAIFMGIYWKFIDFPKDGFIFSSAFFEYYISLFLVMYVSDLMGIVISSAVKNNEMANLIAPIVIIIQLVLSGVLFSLEGTIENIANLTVSKWGMEVMGSIGNLNELPLIIQESFPEIEHEAEVVYEATLTHIFQVWQVLGLFVLVLIILSVILLHSVEKDTR